MEAISETTTPKTSMTWSKRIEKNGITKSISVKSVENGYVIDINTYGRDTTVEGSEYKDVCKTYVSFENPLEESKEEKEEKSDAKESLKDLISSALSSLGGMEV